jgi:hypothetical protein
MCKNKKTMNKMEKLKIKNNKNLLLFLKLSRIIGNINNKKTLRAGIEINGFEVK